MNKPLIKLFKATTTDCFLFDSYMNKIISISLHNFDILTKLLNESSNFYESISSIEDQGFLEFYHYYQENGFFKPNVISKIEHPMSDYIEDILDSSIESINLQVTQNCNLRCDYCPYTGNYYTNRTHCNKKMSLELALKGIDFLFEHSRDVSNINISFYGGEPLLEFETLKRCILYARKKFREQSLSFSITTNGTLLNDEIMDFFVEHNILLTISLDGPKEIHDRFRVFANGKGSFDIVLNNLYRFKKKYEKYYNTNIMFNVVLSKDDFSAEVDNFFSEHSLFEKNEVITTFLSTNYVEHEFETISDEFVEYFEFEKYKCFLFLLKRIEERPRRIQLNNIEQLKKTAKELKNFVGLPEKYHPSGPCIPGRKKLFLTVDGNFYPCERVNELSECAKIGDIKDGISVDKCKTLLNIGKLTSEQCKNCWAISYCKSCFVQADYEGELCPKARLKNCRQYRESILEEFLDLCVLNMYGYHLNDFIVF